MPKLPALLHALDQNNKTLCVKARYTWERGSTQCSKFLNEPKATRCPDCDKIVNMIFCDHVKH